MQSVRRHAIAYHIAQHTGMSDGYSHQQGTHDGFGDRIGQWNTEVEAARGRRPSFAVKNAKPPSTPAAAPMEGHATRVLPSRRNTNTLRQRFRNTSSVSGGALGRELSFEEYRGAPNVRRSFKVLRGHEHDTQRIREIQDPHLTEQPALPVSEPEDKTPGPQRGVRFQTEHEVHVMSASAGIAKLPHKSDFVKKRPEDLMTSVVGAFVVALEVQDKKLEKEMRNRNLAVAFTSLLGVLSMGASAIVTWYTNPTRETGLLGVDAPVYNDLDPSRNGEFVCNLLGYVTSGSTVLCLIMISRFYAIKLRKKRQEWSQQMVLWQSFKRKKAESYSFWQSSLSWWWFLECFMHVVHPMPFMDGTSTFVSIRQKTIYSYLQLWMLMRVYVIARVLHVIHPAYKKRFEILYNNEELAAMNFKMSWQLTMKLYLFSNTWGSMTFLTVLLFVVFGFALFIIERVEQPSTFGQFDKTLFYVFTTTTTIGYGRVTSKSKAGRVITFLMGTYGAVLLTLFSGVVTNIMEPSKEEEIIRNYIASTGSEHKYRVAAALLIQCAWKSCNTYKMLRGQVSKADIERGKAIRNSVLAIGRRKTIEMKEREANAEMADTDTLSVGNSSSSPRTRSQSGKDTSSVGTGGWEKRRAKEEQKAELERATGATTQSRRYSANALITLNTHNEKRVGRRGGIPIHKQTRFQEDMAIVTRLQSKNAQHTDAKNTNTGTLRDVTLRGTMREEMPLTDYTTRVKRQQERGCLPVYAAHHKNNFLFEARKKFRLRKRDLAATKLEPKDPVLDNEVQTVGSLIVDLNEHNVQHKQDLEIMGDRILFQLQTVRKAVEQKFGAP